MTRWPIIDRPLSRMLPSYRLKFSWFFFHPLATSRTQLRHSWRGINDGRSHVVFPILIRILNTSSILILTRPPFFIIYTTSRIQWVFSGGLWVHSIDLQQKRSHLYYVQFVYFFFFIFNGEQCKWFFIQSSPHEWKFYRD